MDAPGLAALRARLPELTLRDEQRLRRRLEQVRGADGSVLADAAARIEAAERRVARRRAAVPAVTYPDALPISRKRDEIAAAIRDHQVVVVAGETGSGKTTQLPKICLELGRGVRGMIGHTQPRRIAARTVAERIAEELDTPLGEAVGYTVRFTDQVGDDTLIKLMTDGILLAELGRDRMLRRYDTLIIDEAHERSLNIDFILGYLTQLLPRRPDLKVVITSATIDPERFARHFARDGVPAPIVEVSGRTYPVDVRYRPIVDPDAPGDEDRDQVQGILDAVDELSAEGPGDVLVFLSGEREIRDTAEALNRRDLRATEVLPLYARLSAAEQHRVFERHAGRRIVLATNVAETSLTVPGIRYVVDPGTARISRYSHRTKVQRLPIERVSQASANQRKGRCGRTSDGICIRLYTEADFLTRPEYTEPEILRTNLASVILQMTALDLGDLGAFPFVDPPDRRNVKAGVDLLHELGAIEPSTSDRTSDGQRRLTQIGRKLAQLPVDPRLARMILEADRNGCVREVVVLAAALSIQDPRERPVDKQQAADEKHRRFVEVESEFPSDFGGYLNLWRYLREQQKELSGNQFRRLCRADFLNYLRVREWQDLVSQLRQVARTLGITVSSTPGDPKSIHASLLAGLLSHIGLRDGEERRSGRAPTGRPGRALNEYLGARGAKFAIFPGSALARKPPRWVMAAELVETSRLWGRIVARIDPDWVEPLAAHLVVRSYSEPHWEKNAGAVMASEKVTLYGVPVVPARKVNYGRIDPALSRELFIRHALVEGDWRTHHAFFDRNRALLADVEDIEHRVRRRDILVDDETLFDFYDQRIPADVVSGRHFDSWWKRTRAATPQLLDFTASMLMNDPDVTVDDYPDVWRQGGLELPLSYQFEPGTDADGVTVHVPLPVLHQLSADGFDRQIPGLREELVTALIRSLPKPVRKNFVPAPNYARLVLDRIDGSPADPPDERPFTDAIGRELRALTGVAVPPGAWRPEAVPPHLRVTFRVEDEAGRALAEGMDLDALKRQLAGQVRASLAAAATDVERAGLRDWAIGTLPRVHEQERAGYRVTSYPALVDEGDSVAVRLLGTPEEQARAMATGTRRLLRLTLPSPVKPVLGRLSNRTKLALGRAPHESVPALLEDTVDAVLDALVAEHGGPAWDADGFAALRDAVRPRLVDALAEVVTTVADILGAATDVEDRLAALAGRAPLAPAVADVRAQLAGLVYPGFVAATGRRRLPDVLRYLRAAARRLEKLADDPLRDRRRMRDVEEVQRAYQEILDAQPPGRPLDDAVREIRWMIEELRVSYYAQPLGTAYPISDTRIYRAIDRLAG